MTRAMGQLILTRAVYRRRYGTDLPEASVPSRFLEEVPAELLEELGASRRSAARVGTARVGTGSAPSRRGKARRFRLATTLCLRRRRPIRSMAHSGEAAPIQHRTKIQFHRQHRRVLRLARKEIQPSQIACRSTQRQEGIPPGSKVRHPKYGEGTVYQREGEGEEAKITVQFPRFGLKKLVEKYAQLEVV